jgi:hypothetical protein
MTTVNVLELLANASETGFEELTLVEPGSYKLELDAAKTRKDGVFVKGRVLEGPLTGKLIGCGQLTFNEKAAGIAKQNLKAMGIDGETLNSIAAQNPASLTAFAEGVAKYIKGRVVTAQLKYNEYNGDMRNQFEIGKIKLESAPALPALGGVPSATPATPAPEVPVPVPVPVPVTPPPEAAAAAPVTVPAVEPVTAPGIPTEDPGF